jgi:hypothetical protein
LRRIGRHSTPISPLLRSHGLRETLDFRSDRILGLRVLRPKLPPAAENEEFEVDRRGRRGLNRRAETRVDHVETQVRPRVHVQRHEVLGRRPVYHPQEDLASTEGAFQYWQSGDRDHPVGCARQ